MSESNSKKVNYDSLWRTLKADGIIRLAVLPINQRKVIKDITNRKNRDLRFKFLMAESGMRAKLEYEVTNAMVIVRLIKTETLESQL